MTVVLFIYIRSDINYKNECMAHLAAAHEANQSPLARILAWLLTKQTTSRGPWTPTRFRPRCVSGQLFQMKCW